jgi:hypothetical protein
MNLRHATALALAFGLFGCSAVLGIETAYLKNPNTGDVVTCGPYKLSGATGAAGEAAERGCIEDYECQGWVRIPSPS